MNQRTVFAYTIAAVATGAVALCAAYNSIALRPQVELGHLSWGAYRTRQLIVASVCWSLLAVAAVVALRLATPRPEEGQRKLNWEEFAATRVIIWLGLGAAGFWLVASWLRRGLPAAAPYLGVFGAPFVAAAISLGAAWQALRRRDLSPGIRTQLMVMACVAGVVAMWLLLRG